MKPDRLQEHQAEEGRASDDAYEQFMRQYIHQEKKQEQIRKSLISNRSRINEEEIVDLQYLYDLSKQQNQQFKVQNDKLSLKLQESRRAHLEALKKINQLKDENVELQESRRAHLEALKKINQLKDENVRLGNANKNNGQVLQDLANDLSKQVKQSVFFNSSFSEHQNEIQRLKRLLTKSQSQSDFKQQKIQEIEFKLRNTSKQVEKKCQEIERLKKLLKQANDQKNNKDKIIQWGNHSIAQLDEDLIKCNHQNMSIRKQLSQLKEILEQKKHQKNGQNGQTQIFISESERALVSESTGSTINTKNERILQFNKKSQAISIDSLVLHNEEYLSRLYGMFKNKKINRFRLLFRASDHDFDAKDTKDKYCSVAHTVLLVKTHSGKVIGGYTPLKWKMLKNRIKQWQHDISGESFVFSISNNHKLTLQSPTENAAIDHFNGYGPIFCGGIGISDRSNIGNKSWSLGNHQLYYMHPEYKAQDEESRIKFSGSPDGYFYTQQWEVHQVIFQE